MKVVFKRSFMRDLKKIRDKTSLKRIQQAIEQVEQTVALTDIAQLKKLQGYEFYYRIRLGDYRLGLQIEDETVTFARCLHRKDIYRYFP